MNSVEITPILIIRIIRNLNIYYLINDNKKLFIGRYGTKQYLFK